MNLLPFRFVETEVSTPADAEFWRDVAAADRLGSRVAATVFLRDLCRTRAMAEALALDSACRHDFVQRRDTDLRQQIERQGFRIEDGSMSGNNGSMAFDIDAHAALRVTGHPTIRTECAAS